jgi:hypothetical protein
MKALTDQGIEDRHKKKAQRHYHHTRLKDVKPNQTVK